MWSLLLLGLAPALAIAQQGEPSVSIRRCGRKAALSSSTVSSSQFTSSTLIASALSGYPTLSTGSTALTSLTSTDSSTPTDSATIYAHSDLFDSSSIFDYVFTTTSGSATVSSSSADNHGSLTLSKTTITSSLPTSSSMPTSSDSSTNSESSVSSSATTFSNYAISLSLTTSSDLLTTSGSTTSSVVETYSESTSSTPLATYTESSTTSASSTVPTTSSDISLSSSLSTSLTFVVTSTDSSSSSSSSIITSSSSSVVVPTSTSSSSTSSTSTGSSSAVTVTPGGTGIASAIAYAQSNGVPTVTIKAGTYTEAIVISATAAVTIVGETNTVKRRDDGSSSADYSQNLVTIANAAAAPLTISSTSAKGATFRNINFSNTNSASVLGAVSLKGSQHAFYSCQFLAAGAVAIQGGISSALIADSYIEATDKVIYQYPSLYIYSSTITATAKSGNLIYTQASSYTANSVTSSYNSTVVFDSCNVAQKSGSTNTYVSLFTGNGAGSVALYRNSTLGSFIAPSGAHVDAKTQATGNTYIEFLTSGAGSYSQNVNARSQYVTLATSGSQVAAYEIPTFFANVNPTVATTQTSWVDQGVLSRILAGVASQDGSATSQSSSSSVASSSTSSSNVATSSSLSSTVFSSSSVETSSYISSTTSSATSSTETSSSVSSTISSIDTTSSSVSSQVSSKASSSASSSTSSSIASSVTTSSASSSSDSSSATISSATSLSSACVLPSSVPSTARVVGPLGSCATYNTISAAVASLPDTTTQYIYILAGTYTEQITISRSGSTVFRGETTDTMSYSSNAVTIQYSASVSSSAGGSASTSPFKSTQYYATSMSFYNINFANTATPTTNMVAVAFVGKALKTGFYGCSFKSGQGTILLNYGAYYFANSYVEGTTDFIWGQGGAYFYNSKIVTTGSTTGQNIAANDYQGSYGPSIQVYDTCAIVPGSSSVTQGSTYLGRDYSTSSTSASSRVYYINSYLDAHIASAGWKVSGSTTNVTFIEANNSGPGASTTSRSSYAQIKSDSSSYTVASVLGDASWLDTSAIAPFAGFPDSVYTSQVSSSSSSASMSATTSSATTSSASISTSSSVSASATSSSTAAASTYTVAPTPTGDQFGSVMSAVAAIPTDGNAHEVYILAGTYIEQVWVNQTGLGKVTLRGETTAPNDFIGNKVTLQFAYGVSTSGSISDEVTPVLNWKRSDGSGLALYNIDFINTNPQAANTAALAADFYGTNMAAYGCSFKGYQDTLLANQGVQIFSNCYIEGSVDFIWGYSKAYFHQCYIASNTAGAYITAQNRPNAAWAGGYIFDSCYVTYTSSYLAGKSSVAATTYLGRPWSQYAIVVYMDSYLDSHIAPAGWAQWSTSSPNTGNVVFGEFNNSGPGAWTTSTSRATFATDLSESQAAAYTLTTFISDTSFIDWTAYNYVPTYSLGTTASATTSASATVSASTSASATASATWAHPTSGTVPPAGAVLVSVGGTEAGSYSSLTDALASLPSDSSTQIIFMYAGTYTEQVPSINRAGPVMIIGYTSGNPGQAYADNTVTITHAQGLSVSPLPTGHSDAETATFSTGGTGKISLYNINIENTENLDGSVSSYVTLAGSIYGQHIGFYACSFVGWQDTLLTGNKAGYQYYESSYVEGAIDFIWGYSKAYFKGCTIGAKRAGSAITAHSRASTTAVGGYIFDQCLFTAAKSAAVDLTSSVYLGRPYSAYALVVVKNSYLDDIIAPAGWRVWSKATPQTDYVTFAEYNNVGPGNWENNAAARVAWQNCTLLTSDTYPLASVMDSTDWIDMTYFNSIVTPTVSTTTTPPASASSTSASPVATSTSEYDGTKPPAGAYIVSKTAIEGVTTYDTIQAALDVLPTSSKTTATVFIYPGTYNEQLVLSKDGTTIFLGYSESPKDYSKNQVIISFNAAVDTQSDASNSDSATVYATGNYFQAVNINFANTFGTASNYASLGFAVKSSKYAGLYGCQVYGNQDALLINGYLFASNSYIEGNVDMIWGSGAGYFLQSTISPNEDKVSLTADKRATSATAGGFVFDQCTVTPASGASFSQISLGRPWNAFARVAYIGTYLASCVESTGFDYWTKSDPRTDGVMFGEYANYGPGAATSGRASFVTQLSVTDVAQFELTNFFASTSWINSTFVYNTPFTAGSLTVPTSSATSSTVSSTSSRILSTSTVTTVVPSTIKTTIFTTSTAPNVIVTQTSTSTLDVGTTVTPLATTQTETVKATSTITNTVTEGDEIVTVRTTIVNDVGTTITPAQSTKTVSTTSTILETQAVTTTAKATTVKSSTTVTSVATSTPKGATTTLSEGTTATVTETVTPKSKQVTSTTTTTVGSGGVTTTTLKAATSTFTTTLTSTKTAKSTTTLSCVPTAAKAKRAIAFGTTDALTILARATAANPVTTVTVFSFTTSATTKQTTVPGSTSTTVVSVIKTTGKTSTLKPTTVLETTTSVALKTATTTLPGSTSTVTVATTKVTGKTSTVQASVTTVVDTNFVTKTTYSTVTVPGSTVTDVETETQKSTTVLVAQTVTVTKSQDVTSKATTTLATPTSTVWKTQTVTLGPSITETVQSTVTKTKSTTSVSTVTSVVSKTKKGATICTAT
ncbi:putative Pectin lyase fold/virulence factor [Seiridium cardinale]